MKSKIFLLLMVLSFLGVAGCDSSDIKYLECIARDKTPNPCN